MSSEQSITVPLGFSAAGVACGLKPNGALDLALIASDRDCVCAGVFTTNRVRAAPVIYDEQVLAANRTAIRAVVANSGCANACTGAGGMEDTRATAQAVARALGCRADQVLVLSTGVIGKRLDMPSLLSGIEKAVPLLSPDGGAAAARAIMTTDTRPKTAAICRDGWTIAGMSKGAGMIHPQMATMLAVVTTDARVSSEWLSTHLLVATEESFNRISIDGDMSTNDTVLLLANGASGVEIDEEHLKGFIRGLVEVTTSLAKQIVRDGEGASKFVEITVTGATDKMQATQVARSIANSPLVKTALYGGDANWGRVIAAAGYSGIPVIPERMTLWFGSVNVFFQGIPTAYDEADSAAAIAGHDVSIRLDLGMGTAEATMWTCDLSHDYVTINGKYRT